MTKGAEKRRGLLLAIAFGPCLVMPIGAAAQEGVEGEVHSAALNESGGERQVLKFNDLGASVGMAPPASHGGFAVNRELLRGFPNESALRNGFRDFGYLGLESTVAREGVEVFRGPASALYGNGKPGGDLNVLTRQPDGVRRRDAQLSASRQGYRTFKADLSDAAGDDLALRLSVGAEGGPSRRQFDDEESYGVTPSIAWRVGPRTRVALELDLFSLRDQVQPERLPLAPLLAFSDRKTLGEASDWARESGSTWRLALEHAFDENWRMRQAFFLQRSRSSRDATELDVYGMTGDGILTADERSVRRVAARRREGIVSEVSQTEIHGQFDLHGAKHQVLAGVELGRYQVHALGSRAPLAALDLAAPVHGALPGGFVRDTDQLQDGRTSVLHLRDRMRWGNHWQLLLGLRAEQSRAASEDRLRGDVNTGRSSLLSPRAGLVYSPRPGWSWFASWTQSSRPQLGEVAADGALLPPEKGRQIEAGIQWGDAKQGLLGTLSLYQLRRQGLAATDPRNPNFVVAGGERQSHGVELELRGELMRGLSLDFSLEALRARVRRDTAVASGTPLPGVAPWFMSAWLTKQLSERWTLGWGLIGEGPRRAAWPPDALRLPAYVTTDVALAYRAPGWRLQVAMGNVLGRRAIVSDGYAVSFIEPRSLSVTLSMRL
jgi:iron complex outermembrane receptor protein